MFYFYWLWHSVQNLYFKMATHSISSGGEGGLAIEFVRMIVAVSVCVGNSQEFLQQVAGEDYVI